MKDYIYDTPLIAYCFAVLPISIGAVLFDNILISVFFYLFVYFGGMHCKCKEDDVIFDKILENNSNFLKLSFLPFTFSITIIGFIFTFHQVDVVKIVEKFKVADLITRCVQIYPPNTYSLDEILKSFVSIISNTLFLYLLSLPIQAISYYIIEIIKYFRKYKQSYKKLFLNYLNFLWERIKKMAMNNKHR